MTIPYYMENIWKYLNPFQDQKIQTLESSLAGIGKL